MESIDFAFILARVMRFYGWTYWEALDQPIEAFWTLSAQIDRIQAEEDMRLFEASFVAQRGGEESVRAYRERLQRQVGTVQVDKPVFDREALGDLKALGGF